MPRSRGIGRTGAKHKRAANFDVHQQIKGVDDVFQQPPPASAEQPTDNSSAGSQLSPLDSLSALRMNIPSPLAADEPGDNDADGGDRSNDEMCDGGGSGSGSGSDDDDSARDAAAEQAAAERERGWAEWAAASGADQPGQPAMLMYGPAPPPPAKIRRVYGSRLAVKAIFEAVELEVLLAHGEPQDEEDAAQLAAQEKAYGEALSALKHAFPALARCCGKFDSGGCEHVKPCECGWKGAPYPWIVYRPGGRFCDCHMWARRYWSHEALALHAYHGTDTACTLWPKAGPHHGDGL